MLYNIGGNLLEDFFNCLCKMNFKPRSIARQRAKISWIDKFIGYLKTKSIHDYVKKIGVNPDYLHDKYIYFALHFEPEASIMARTVLESQLTIAKMISDCLPKGWVLYVKEHPSQFIINNDQNYSFFTQIPTFKSKIFYDYLLSMKNIRFIKANTSSEKLIEHSQAVVSITGTILFESVLNQKPILVFSELQPTSKLKGAFCVQSFDECKRAIQIIQKGYQPDYNDKNEIMKKYVFKGEHMADNLMGLLYDEC